MDSSETADRKESQDPSTVVSRVLGERSTALTGAKLINRRRRSTKLPRTFAIRSKPQLQADDKTSASKAVAPATTITSVDEKVEESVDENPLPWFEKGLERVPRPRPEPRPGHHIWIKYVPRVYLEDVEAIAYLIGKQCKHVSMRTEEFKISSPNQLRDVPQEKIMGFVIEGKQPYVNVEISSLWFRVYTPHDDPEVNFLVEEIVSVLNRRQRRVLKLLDDGRTLVVSLFISLIAAAIFIRLELPLLVALAPLLILPLWILTVIFASTFVSSTRKGVIIPMYKRELPKAWYASNELKVAVIAAVVTAVVTAILSIYGTLTFLETRPAP
jgi:hypothetical protein